MQATEYEVNLLFLNLQRLETLALAHHSSSDIENTVTDEQDSSTSLESKGHNSQAFDLECKRLGHIDVLDDLPRWVSPQSSQMRLIEAELIPIKLNVKLQDEDLYVAPDTRRDELHRAVKRCVSLPDDRVYLMLLQNVDARECLIRSPIRLGLESSCQLDFGQSVAAMVALIERRRAMDPSSDRYSKELTRCIQSLHPRGLGLNPIGRRALLQQKLLRNALGVSKDLACCLLDEACFIDHSCAPNVVLRMDAELREAKIVSLYPLVQGTVLKSCYIPFPIDSKDARKALIEKLSFECNCECCSQNLPPSHSYAVYNAMQLSETQRHCWWCGTQSKTKVKVKLCAACRCAAYCSIVCQRQDLAIHASICNLLNLTRKLLQCK